MLAALCMGLSLLSAAVTFVATSGGSLERKGLESSSYVHMRGPAMERTAEEPQTGSALRAVGLATVLGLMAGLAPVAAPVRAEEAATEAAPAAAPAAAPVELSSQERAKKEITDYLSKQAAAPSKEERVKRALAQIAQEDVSPDFALERGLGGGGGVAADQGVFKPGTTRKKVREPKKKSESSDGGFFGIKLPSFSSSSTEDAPKKTRVIISPADELDEDELSWARPNPLLFWTLLLGPSFIFLGFWVAGSLNIL